MGPGFQGVKQDIEPTVYFAAKIKRSIENKKNTLAILPQSSHSN